MFAIHKKRDFACRIPYMQFRFSHTIWFVLTFITFRGFPSSLAPSFTLSRYPVTSSRNSTIFITSALTVWSKPPKFTLCKKWILSQNRIYTFWRKKKLEYPIHINWDSQHQYIFVFNQFKYCKKTLIVIHWYMYISRST